LQNQTKNKDFGEFGKVGVKLLCTFYEKLENKAFGKNPNTEYPKYMCQLFTLSGSLYHSKPQYYLSFPHLSYRELDIKYYILLKE